MAKAAVRRREPGHNPVRPKRNYCFACGADNREGLRLKFALDGAGKRFVSRFRLPRRFVGPPGHAHGGIIATILDEAMTKLNRLSNILAVTAEMQVQYLKPVPLRAALTVEGWELRVRGREHLRVAEITNEAGEVLARGRGKFVEVDTSRVFRS
jgi:uncharacterized protein (TIGR00369 family)